MTFDAAMRNLDSIIKELNGRPLLLVGDINAKHQAWGSHISDERGKKFYDFAVLIIFIFRLNIILLVFSISPQKKNISFKITNVRLHQGNYVI